MKLNEWNLAGKRVLLRADLNVPLENGVVAYTHRLEQLKPTLDFLLFQGATVILATHIGRPTKPTPTLSTEQLVPWFKQHGYGIQFVPDLNQAHELSKQKKNNILLLENMRFFPGEKNHDPAFAKKIAQLGDYYVNDAFGLIHRNDSSITHVPELFPPEKRSIGFLIEKEMAALHAIRDNPVQPFVLILGGGKVKDKIPFLTTMITKITTLLLCPAPVFTFLYAQHQKKYGKSLIDSEAVSAAKEILNRAHEHGVSVYFPDDYVIAKNSFNGPLHTVKAAEFPDNGVGISIGPETIKKYSALIAQAKIVFYNGLMGAIDRPETLAGSQALFRAMANNATATTIIGGGDSVAATQMAGLDQQITHLSTGGGATLAYLAGQELPGIAWMNELKYGAKS